MHFTPSRQSFSLQKIKKNTWEKVVICEHKLNIGRYTTENNAEENIIK